MFGIKNDMFKTNVVRKFQLLSLVNLISFRATFLLPEHLQFSHAIRSYKKHEIVI